MTTTITQQPSYVFVYGTLCHGQKRDINCLQPSPIFMVRCKISGTLYDLRNYPGVRLGGAHWVWGEVYQITAQLEQQLDEIEEVWPQQTGEYVKRQVVVQCDGRELICLVYELTQTYSEGRDVITSGDWINWQSSSVGRTR